MTADGALTPRWRGRAFGEGVEIRRQSQSLDVGDHYVVDRRFTFQTVDAQNSTREGAGKEFRCRNGVLAPEKEFWSRKRSSGAGNGVLAPEKEFLMPKRGISIH